MPHGILLYKYMIHFTEFRNPFLEDDLKSMFLWTMNDLAYLDQAMNVIEPVEVYIDFYDTY